MNKPTWFPLWHNHPEKNDPGWFYFLNIYLFEGRVTETEEETDTEHFLCAASFPKRPQQPGLSQALHLSLPGPSQEAESQVWSNRDSDQALRFGMPAAHPTVPQHPLCHSTSPQTTSQLSDLRCSLRTQRTTEANRHAWDKVNVSHLGAAPWQPASEEGDTARTRLPSRI